MDEIVTLKNLWIGFNLRSGMYRCFLIWLTFSLCTLFIETLYTFPDSGFKCLRCELNIK